MGSLFLFEMLLDEFNCYPSKEEYIITAQFADVFKLNLRDPKRKEVSTRKHKIKGKLGQTDEPKVQMGQTVLFESNIEDLINKMTKYPIQLSLRSKHQTEYMLGCTNIPWCSECLDYLRSLHYTQDLPPLMIKTEHKVFNEITSKRIAFIKITMKMSHLRDKNWAPSGRIADFQSENNRSPSTLTASTIPRRCGAEESAAMSLVRHPSETVLSHSHRNTLASNSTDIFSILMGERNDKPNSNKNFVTLIKSTTSIETKQHVVVLRSRSYSSLDCKQHVNTLSYIFGDVGRKFANKVYYVGYVTVQNVETSETPSAADKSDKTLTLDPSSETDNTPKNYYKYKLCDSACQNTSTLTEHPSMSILSFDLPEAAKEIIEVTRCRHVTCDDKEYRKPLTPPDPRHLIDMRTRDQECCTDQMAEKIEQVIGGITATVKMEKDPCYCSCECTFGFVKKTTYCGICGGFEEAGDEVVSQKPGQLPFPCPIFHKLPDKSKIQSEKKEDTKGRSRSGKRESDKKSADIEDTSDKEGSKKGKKKFKDERFKFNYGYQGIPPKIGHSQCGLGCGGLIALDPVPKRMGWLWTAEDVPGMKFRPNWKPGACNKKVVRLLRFAKYPEQELAKRRRKDSQLKKRPLQRPLLVVQKQAGEFTVTLETMKTYNKLRAPNQHPFEDKDPVFFTIGRTEEENLIRRKKKERKARRLEREQRDFIQGAFRNLCEEICLKTYRQALGLLPDAEDPQCPCYPAEPKADDTNLDRSCSCSDTLSSMTSDTDEDEWLLEFTPPIAQFNPNYSGKKIGVVDKTTQYTYLDFKVKLLDRFGNPVPRFFKGPDGREQCSDLGGFWSPDKQWLEINVDGFIGPDNRWAPNIFYGPLGDQIEAENGKFQMPTGEWLVVGVDGYIDSAGKWKYYGATNRIPAKEKKAKRTVSVGVKKNLPPISEATWSCFGDASPKGLSKMGIVGHGHDKRMLLNQLQSLLSKGEEVTLPEVSLVPRLGYKGKKLRNNIIDKKCKHAAPSKKGIIAVNERGHKTYFTLIDYKNPRPKQRREALTGQGISLSSFHVPCLSSFINCEMMKQKQIEHILKHNAKFTKDVGI